ncbi:MAG: phenylalanine--tRNA ligase subunit alpha, partial [Thiomonas arsenitoxydans]|nr:phenylalanine--tRNA ligase subunit alpha [Thiomonas arsenitoxydans]
MNPLQTLIDQASAEFSQATDSASLENAKARYLGKTGLITIEMKALAALPAEEKRSRGAEINLAKQAIEQALQLRREAIEQAALQAQLQAQAIDVTLPGRAGNQGGLHPLTRSWMRMEQIFRSMGFDVADGPEIEDDWT